MLIRDLQNRITLCSELSGKEYNIDNLGDVYDAIHVIQGELGLTGVAADEAASTFTGSLGAMKAAGENLLASLMLGQDVGPSMDALLQTTVTFLAGNLLPAVANIFASLPSAIRSAIQTGLPLIAEQAGNLITSLTDGINTKIPELASKLPGMVQTALDTISTLAPQVASKGMELITNLGQAIVNNAPALASAAADAIQKFVSFFEENYPKIAEKGGELVGKLAKGIITHIPQILTAVAKIGVFLLKNLARIATTMIRGGLSIVRNIASGIKSGIGSLIGAAMRRIKDAITKPISAAKDKVKSIMNKIKSIFPLRVGKIFSNLRIPHISVSGGKAPFGIGGLGSKPSISVSWHKKAMENPYLFSNATLFGAGESGDEMLYGRNRLMKDISDAVSDGGGSGDINIYLSYNAGADASDMVRDIAREIRLYRMAGAI